jgi:hypothetical protein
MKISKLIWFSLAGFALIYVLSFILLNLNKKNKSWEISSAVLGNMKKYVNSHGDTWNVTWVNDGKRDRVIAFADDCLGWYNGCGNTPDNFASNFAIQEIYSSDNSYNYNTLDGKTINPMKSGTCNYGKLGFKEMLACDDRDGILRSWKGDGITCINNGKKNVLFLTISRHRNMEVPDLRHIQKSENAGIIKSYDYGMTWIPSNTEFVANPMFKDSSFATPYFVQFGRNGMIQDDKGEWHLPERDRADRYIYAVSNNGSWNKGNYMKLGRVKREKIEELNSSDWEFYCGPVGDNAGNAGMDDKNWTKDAYSASHIIENKGKLSMEGIQYIWQIKRYVMLQWYYPDSYCTSFDSKHSFFCFYQSPTPWGPWTIFYEKPNTYPTGFYNPIIIPNSIKLDKKNKRCTMTLITEGDWRTCFNDEPNNYYKIHAIELTLLLK